MALFLFSCQQNTPPESQDTPQISSIIPESPKTTIPTADLTIFRVGFRDFRIPAHFEKFFANKNLNTPYASTNALIVYTDQNGDTIDTFANITQNTTAHIFADSYCYNEKNETIHLQSSYCDHQQCEFPEYDHFSLEELIHNDLFNTINKEPWKIS